MKKLLSLLSLLCMSMGVFAQGSLLATLSHDGQISAFYGADALKSAVAVAEAGDVITLSSGQFSSANISKPITLRGSGMSVSTDSINAHEATIIQGDFTINIADSLEGRVVMEGLYFNQKVTYAGVLKNAQFLKCRFGQFVGSNNPVMTNTSFIHCRIFDYIYLYSNSNAFFINCIVNDPVCPSSSTVEFDNCFVKFDSQYINAGDATDVNNAYYKNCIIQIRSGYGGSSMIIPSSCTAYNCIGLGYSDIFHYLVGKNNTNRYVSGLSNVFKTYNNTSSNINDSDNFELTETAATTYLGTDGTQVGIYGGNLAYDENPTIPQITKCNVASKSTADGKLSVDIEVKAAEY